MLWICWLFEYIVCKSSTCVRALCNPLRIFAHVSDRVSDEHRVLFSVSVRFSLLCPNGAARRRPDAAAAAVVVRARTASAAATTFVYVIFAQRTLVAGVRTVALFAASASKRFVGQTCHRVVCVWKMCPLCIGFFFRTSIPKIWTRRTAIVPSRNMCVLIVVRPVGSFFDL